MFQAATLSQPKFKALRKGNTVWNLKFLCRRRFTWPKVLWHTLISKNSKYFPKLYQEKGLGVHHDNLRVK